MPTTSSYYSDLEYPTVNEDASTYGTLINTYLNDLLGKLETISTRVTNSQAQLGNINRGTNAVDRINNTLAGAIGSSALLPSTGTTLLPDPYSGTYTKTTSWPAFTSELSSYSPPTTQSEVENFDYQGFAAALQTEVDRIDATVTQAEADILQARKDTCRTKKYIEVYETGGITVKNSEFVFFTINGITQFILNPWYNYVSSSYSNGILTVNYTLDTTTTNGVVGTPAEAHQALVDVGILSNGSATTVYRNETAALAATSVGSTYIYDYGGDLPMISGSSASVTWYAYSSGQSASAINLVISGPSIFTSWNSRISTLGLAKRRVIEETVYGTPDLSSCENPSPPYFT
jgi:hypothetical protein